MTGMPPPRHPGMPTPRSQAASSMGGVRMMPSIDTAGGVRMIPSIDTAATGEESVIMELSRRLSEREAEIRTIAQQKMTLERFMNRQQQQSQLSPRHAGNNQQAYNTLLASLIEREEQLLEREEQLLKTTHRLQEMEKLARELQHSSNLQRQAMKEHDENMAKFAKLDAENKKKDGMIDSLNKEKQEIFKKSKKTESELKDQLAGYEGLVAKSKSLAEEQINVLLQNEKTIGGIEAQKTELEKEIERLNDEMKKHEHTVNSKDALLNMQRQGMSEMEATIKLYETKFQAKDVDVPKIIARAEEGERLWSKIEEREKKYAGKEIVIGVLRSENSTLQDDKKRLQGEVEELQRCFEMYNLKMKGTGDKVHMPWLMTQLRDSVQLKEKVVELEQIIKSGGYTVKAAEAEADLKKKGKAMSLEMTKLTQLIETLRGQIPASPESQYDLEVPVLLGKLEECLLVFGHEMKDTYTLPDDEMLSQILLSVASSSSEINQSMSLNTADDSNYDKERWVKSRCITARDFKDFMHPRHYAVVSSLAEGFNEGLCSAANNGEEEDVYDEDDDDDEEDGVEFQDVRDDVIGNATRYDSGSENPSAAGGGGDGGGEGEDAVPDIHIEKVLKIIQQEKPDDDDDWRNWVSQPDSLCDGTTTSASAE